MTGRGGGLGSYRSRGLDSRMRGRSLEMGRDWVARDGRRLWGWRW